MANKGVAKLVKTEIALYTFSALVSSNKLLRLVWQELSACHATNYNTCATHVLLMSCKLLMYMSQLQFPFATVVYQGGYSLS